MTIVSGVGGGTIELALPSEATLDLSHGSHEFERAKVEGSGPIVGFVLTNDWDALPTEDERSIYGVQMGQGYFDGWRVSAGWTLGGLGTRFTLPAGEYSLYLLSDGSPVTVTLPFDGRPGETSVTVERTTPQSVEVLENRAPAPAGAEQWNVASVGESGDFGPGGFVLMWVASPGSSTVLGDMGDYCFYNFIPSNEDTAYWPGCPATYLDDGTGWHVTGVGIGGGVVFWHEPRGEFAHGYSHETAEPDPTIRVVSVTLRYDLGDGGSAEGLGPWTDDPHPPRYLPNLSNQES